MISVSASTIALPPGDHDAVLSSLPELGIEALEVAPSRRWDNTWQELKPSDVTTYRRVIETTGLSVLGLHSLLFDHKDLSLFGDEKTQNDLADFLVHLSAVCRDLGGRTLIWGGGRLRHDVPITAATNHAISFMGDVCHRIEKHGTCFCFEPLGPTDSDFINSAREALEICHAISHPALQMQLDAKALFENNEITEDLFVAVADELVHVHANEPGLAVVGSSGDVDHKQIGQFLRRINYNGYVSAEQRMLSKETWRDDLAASAAFIRQAYCHGDPS
ncbi:sugar phosphate isomerase/epimerase [Rhodospirillales bacterium]|nr:sugar phosphate isomerase/epimerase [Rhodospirillales bacterium]